MLDANFWQNKSISKTIIKEKKFFEELIESYNDSVKGLTDLNDLYKLAEEEANSNVSNEVFKNIKELRLSVKKNEIRCFLSNEADHLIAILKFMLVQVVQKVKIGLTC